MATELTALPDSFSAGTTVVYRKSFSDYPASAGWTLKLYLAGVKVLNKTAAADGDEFVMTLAAADTDTELDAGLYKWVERVSNVGGEVYEVASGVVTVLANMATATAGQQQDWRERAIALLRAQIEGRLPAGMENYSIAGRAVGKMTIEEAAKLLSQYEAKLAAARNPGGFGRDVLVQFSKPGFSQ